MNREFIHKTLAAEVSPEKQVHLARAAEEASELVKEAMKALRFGLDNRYPADGLTNGEKIVMEFYDVQAALVDAGLLSGAFSDCTGSSARWCPKCGDCSGRSPILGGAPSSEHCDDDDCPLHGVFSNHGGAR